MTGITPQFYNHAAALLHGIGGHNLVPHLLDAYGECDDFRDLNTVATTGQWVETNFTAGTARIIDGKGGLLKLDAASQTDDQGVQLQRRVETFLPASGKDILFECMFNLSHPADCQFFAGLSVLDTNMFASGVPTMSDYIGFVLDATEQAGANAGKPSLELNSAGGSEEKLAAVATPVAATNIRLGWWLKSNGLLTPIANGIPGTALDITSCPATELAASFLCISESSPAANPNAIVDWYYCLQLR